MEITEVKVYPVRKPDDKLKAFVTIILDDCFVIRDLKIINGNSGLFVAMPSRKKTDGTYADIAHPLNMEMRQQMEDCVLQEYKKIMEENPPDE
ncbi:MAG: septation regulator SpoVG [Candidatus Omnitrophota bacterium]|jgi:stage V sporulation protein G|nr:MAG: septation regulator SpoVG [Candidatus Omnitrophota bacterium]